jgi:hypothetical protein
MSLYGRRCVVTVDQLVVEGLDVRFAVELAQRTYGKAEIQIYNFNQEHRQEIEAAQAVRVQLEAGYVGEQLSVLFQGSLRDAFSQKDAQDWITTLRTGDGDKARKARISRSYTKGTSLSTVRKDLTDVLAEAGISVGNAVEAFQRGEYANGIQKLLGGGVSQGLALDILRQHARSAGLDVDIQGEELVVTPRGRPLDTTAIRLSPGTGLIGSPQKGAKGELRARALILPGLLPKRKVQIESALVSGLYTVIKAKYTGDTAGNDWYVDLECKEL